MYREVVQLVHYTPQSTYLYTSPHDICLNAKVLGELIKDNKISYHSYADDTQIDFALTKTGLVEKALTKLTTGCLNISCS